APLIVTLLVITVSGLAKRLGVTTARRLVCPSFSLTKAFANASPTGPPFDPSNRSMCASSLPSPVRASPVASVIAIAVTSLSYCDAGGRNPTPRLKAERGTSRASGAARVRAGGVSGQAGQHHPGSRFRRGDLRGHAPVGDRAGPGVRARGGPAAARG